MKATQAFRQGLALGYSPRLWGFLCVSALAVLMLTFFLFSLAGLAVTGQHSWYAFFVILAQYSNGLNAFTWTQMIVYGTTSLLIYIASMLFFTAFFDVCCDFVVKRPVSWFKSMKRAAHQILAISSLAITVSVCSFAIYGLCSMLGIASLIGSYCMILVSFLFSFSPLVIVREQLPIPAMFKRSFNVLKDCIIQFLGLIGLYWVAFVLTTGAFIIIALAIVLVLEYLLNTSLVELTQQSTLFAFVAAFLVSLVLYLWLYLYTAFSVGLASVYLSEQQAGLGKGN